MELACLVGDTKEVHLDSLKWKEVWVKIACKDPKKINGTSDVYINKQGHMISWFVADKGPVKPPQMNTGKGGNDDEFTDEEEPESQDSYGNLDSKWLKSGPPPQQGGSDLNSKEAQGGDKGAEKPQDLNKTFQNMSVNLNR